MADTVKPIRIEGVALLDYQKSKGLISKNARKPRSMTRKKRQDDELEGQREDSASTPPRGGASPSNSPPGPSIDYRSINVSRTGAASSPLTSTKIGGASATPSGGAETPSSFGEGVKTPEKPKMPFTPAKNVATPSKQSNIPPEQPTFLSNVKGGALVTTPGHMPNTPITSPLTPAMEAAKEAGTLPPQGGGKAKMELAPPKKKGTRHGIVLAPPRESKKRHVRGHTRKIRVQLSNMKRRLHTAKVIHKQSSDKPIEEVRKLLEDAKLIRTGKSSIPESLLRNMYRDYLVLRSKAL
jgi:hypothetical protein